MVLGGIAAGAAGGAAVSIVINAVDNFSGVMKNVNKSMLAVGTGMISLGAIGATALFKATQGASDLEEETSKLNTVFKKIGKQKLDKTIKSLGKAYILSDKATTRLVASTGDLLTGLGITEEKSLDLSTSVLSLGSDLASFNNFAGGATGATEILTKALLGERESLKSLGISILESDVKLQLLKNGTDSLTGSALKAARAEATLQLITEQSGNAMGDTARTSESLANQQRELQRQFENLSDTIGTTFIPIVTEGVSQLSSLLGVFNELNPETQKSIGILAGLTTGFLLLGGAVSVVLAVFSPLVLATSLIIGGIAGIIFGIVKLSKMIRTWDNLWLGLKNTMISFGNVILLIWNGIVNTISGSINSIVGMINLLINKLNRIPGVGIPLVPKIDLSTIKAEMIKFDFGTISGQSGVPSSLNSSQQTVTNINIDNVNGLDPDEVANSLQSLLEGKIST